MFIGAIVIFVNFIVFESQFRSKLCMEKNFSNFSNIKNVSQCYLPETCLGCLDQIQVRTPTHFLGHSNENLSIRGLCWLENTGCLANPWFLTRTIYRPKLRWDNKFRASRLACNPRNIRYEQTAAIARTERKQSNWFSLVILPNSCGGRIQTLTRMMLDLPTPGAPRNTTLT